MSEQQQPECPAEFACGCTDFHSSCCPEMEITCGTTGLGCGRTFKQKDMRMTGHHNACPDCVCANCDAMMETCDFQKVICGVCLDQVDEPVMQHVFSLRARLAEAEAGVKELGDSLLQAQQDRITNSSQWSAMYDEIARQRNENLDRALKAEARVKELESENHRLKVIPEALEKMNADLKLNLKSARRKVDRLDKAESQLAQVKALLDGIGPEIAAIHEYIAGDQCGAAGEISTLLSAISKFQEVLKGV